MARKPKGENSTDPFLSLRDRLLLALKPCPMDSLQIYDRFTHGVSNAIVALVDEGLIVRTGRGVDAVYTLTEQGRRAVPKRREIMSPRPPITLDNGCDCAHA